MTSRHFSQEGVYTRKSASIVRRSIIEKSTLHSAATLPIVVEQHEGLQKHPPSSASSRETSHTETANRGSSRQQPLSPQSSGRRRREETGWIPGHLCSGRRRWCRLLLSRPVPRHRRRSSQACHPKAQIKFEKERQQATSKEHNRDIISSQHAQVRQSWENPGVYAWGSNAGKVVDQQSKETYVKLPRRIPYFDGKLLRDVKLTQNFGVAVTEEGNLVQWGLGFSQVDPSPAETLKGKNLTKIAVSDDRILALASNGAVYAVPASLGDQDTAEKAQARAQQSSSSSSSWFPFWELGRKRFSSPAPFEP
ncbi:conserved hypothetical protein [Verticillium alfalfae VaMs.102]|uniref:Uncharacterized protein n=1 Tax=Verticillium alfalfae (strain VaMs.102 / ATCC MYA-4576 / FGSC 10136) TaxID=526221 RepID=C9SGK7_VERA1|nr:conserved hypothetical protein [Verticillium alfalfae VaMs.102]EEY17524.1 conserved hypothetical protein [Verticillium alfalfae VaMs.102]